MVLGGGQQEGWGASGFSCQDSGFVAVGAKDHMGVSAAPAVSLCSCVFVGEGCGGGIVEKPGGADDTDSTTFDS